MVRRDYSRAVPETFAMVDGRWSDVDDRTDARTRPVAVGGNDDGRSRSLLRRITGGPCSFDPISQSEVETCGACGRAVLCALSSPYVDDILCDECAMKHVIERTACRCKLTLIVWSLTWLIGLAFTVPHL
jgi:hypothetical protein